ncbi:lipoprotein, putative, partial [Microscilla marina ATCC 23134]
MKLAYSLLILLIFAGCTKTPEPNNTNQFIKFFGSAKNETANAMVSTTDGGYLIVGSTTSFNLYEQAFLAKADANGNVQWTQHYGIDSTNDGNVTVARSAIEVDGNFLVLGEGTKGDTTNFLLYQVDASGTQLGYKEYATTTKTDQGYYISAINGGYMMIGTTGDGTIAQNNNIKAIKIDNNRDVVFEKSDGITNAVDGLGNIIEISTQLNGADVNDFLWVGTSKRLPDDTDARIIRLNDIGGIRWEENYGKLDSKNQTGAEIKVDGKDYVIVGNTNLNDNGDVYIVKVDADGKSLAEYVISLENEQIAESIEPVSDGYIVAGTNVLKREALTNNITASTAFLMKVKADGTMDWVKEFGDLGKDVDGVNSGRFVKAINGGSEGYLLLGSFDFFGSSVMGLVRTNSDGTTL